MLGERQELVANAASEARWNSQAPPTTPATTETPPQLETPTATRQRRERTATPTAPPSETPTAPPSETPTAQSAETALPTEAATPAAPAPDQAAGGTVPSTLPRTSAPGRWRGLPWVMLGALLLCAGALLRPRR